jgi:hypothetical protein
MAPTPDEMQERLEQLEAGTAAARERAEADGLLPEDDPDEVEPTLADPDGDLGQAGDGMPGEATGELRGPSTRAAQGNPRRPSAGGGTLR